MENGWEANIATPICHCLHSTLRMPTHCFGIKHAAVAVAVAVCIAARHRTIAIAVGARMRIRLCRAIVPGVCSAATVVAVDGADRFRNRHTRATWQSAAARVAPHVATVRISVLITVGVAGITATPVAHV